MPLSPQLIATLDAQIACVLREIALRKRVYPRFVKNLRMTEAQATHEIAMMTQVYETLNAVRDAYAPQIVLFPQQRTEVP